MIDEAAVETGRDPAAIRRLLNIGGRITVPGAGDRSEPGRSVGQLGGGLGGPPEYWLELLGSLAQIGFDTFVFWPTEPSTEQVELLAEAVAPTLRARG